MYLSNNYTPIATFQNLDLPTLVTLCRLIEKILMKHICLSGSSSFNRTVSFLLQAPFPLVILPLNPRTVGKGHHINKKMRKPVSSQGRQPITPEKKLAM